MGTKPGIFLNARDLNGQRKHKVMACGIAPKQDNKFGKGQSGSCPFVKSLVLSKSTAAPASLQESIFLYNIEETNHVWSVFELLGQITKETAIGQRDILHLSPLGFTSQQC
jgi:hypothetical protein